MRKIAIDLGDKLDVYIGSNELDNLVKLTDYLCNINRFIIVIEDNIKKFYLGMIRQALSSSKAKISEIIIDTTKDTRNLITVNGIISALEANELNDSAAVLIVGGNQLIDTIGFACGLIKGNKKTILLPTSLSAMVNANFEGDYSLRTVSGRVLNVRKSPSMVYIDTCFLTTLPKKEYSNCLALVAKVEILKGMGLLDALIEYDINGMYVDLICECIKIKYGYSTSAIKTKKINMLTIGEPYTTIVRNAVGKDYPAEICEYYGLYLLCKDSSIAHLGAGLIVDALERLALKYGIDLDVTDSIKISQEALIRQFGKVKSINMIVPYAFGNCIVEETTLSSPLMYTTKLVKKNSYDICITNTKNLAGDIEIYNSMSIGHYLILLSSFAATTATITKLSHNDDNQAVVNALRSLGFSVIVGDDWCDITQSEKFFDTVSGVAKSIIIDVKESESMLSTLLCVVSMLGLKVTFKGNENVLTKSIKEQILYMRTFGVEFDKPTLPFTVKGYLNSGEYTVNNKTNEQLLIALIIGGFCSRGSFAINLTAPLKTSQGAVMILDVIRKMGAKTISKENRIELDCSGADIIDKLSMNGENSFSNLACWMTMKALGAKINFTNTIKTVSRAEKALLDFINAPKDDSVKPEMNISNYLELAPYLAVMNLAMKRYYNLKVSSEEQVNKGMLNEIATCIREIGGKCDFSRNQLSIYVGELKGGEIDSYGSPYIIMAWAALSIVLKGELIIKDAHLVSKSYPSFWEDLGKLGAEYKVMNVDELIAK